MLAYSRKEAGATCGFCDKESLNEHRCCGEALSRRPGLLLGLNSVHPSSWQIFPVGIEVLEQKVPGSQWCLVRIWHFPNAFIWVEQTLLSQGLERESKWLGPARLAGQEPG